MSLASQPRTASRGLLAALALVLLGTGCSSGDLEVVAILPETGHLSAYGEDMKRGVELAARLAREQDGVLDNYDGALNLTFIDDGSNPDRAVTEVLSALSEDPPFAIIGPVHAEAWLGLGLDAEEAGVSLVSPWVSYPTGDFRYKSLFRTFPTDQLEAGRLAKLMRRDLQPRVKDLVVFTELTDYGRGYKAAFSRAFRGLQGNVESSKYYERGLQPEQAAEMVEELRLKPAGGVLLIATGADYKVLLDALRAIDYREPIFATSAFHQPDVRRGAGPAGQDVLYVAPLWNKQSDMARDFAAAYRDEYGESPSLWAVLGHDALTVVLKGAADMGGAYRGDLPGLMRSLNFDSPGALRGSMRFDSAGECADCPLGVYGVRDGTALPWDTYAEHWKERYPESS